MCGICGVLHFDDRPPSSEILAAMTTQLRHRGPDGEGFHIQGNAGLGHRRLAIIDLSESGRQPMASEDGTVWITYNGEIYNYRELRRELEDRGCRFRSNSDTEVIIKAYQIWGKRCLDRLRGMFAFGLWDAAQREMWLVRDRLGIKPLFYAITDDRLLFASEIKSILCDPAVEREINLEALHHFLSLNYVPAPYTLFAGVRQLLPGQFITVTAGGNCREQQYWDLSYAEKLAGSERDLMEEFELRLSSVVEQHMISDVPLGAFLSGGVDSSAIAYWMSRHSIVPVQTFSVGFREDSYNESDYARTVANACKTDHHERVVEPDTIALLPKIVWHSEEPTADSSMLPFYHLAGMAREKVTVALSGDGADEILAGYETYQAYYAARLYRLLPAKIRTHIIQRLVSRLPTNYSKVSLDFRLKRFVIGAELDAAAGHAYWRTIFDEDMKRSLYLPSIAGVLNGADTTELYHREFAKTDATNQLERMLYVDTRLYLPSDMLVKVDRMSMAHGLEARVPYLDHELVEFVAALPTALKLKQIRKKKYILKAALSRRLPEGEFWRRKQGLNVPTGIWLRHELRDFAFDHLSTQQVKRMGLFRPSQVCAILNEHTSGTRDNSHQIWGLLCLSLWWQQYMGSGWSQLKPE